jgi:hypothetical protein
MVVRLRRLLDDVARNGRKSGELSRRSFMNDGVIFNPPAAGGCSDCGKP